MSFALRLTPPLNLPAAGKRQSVYVVFPTLHRPVFLINSRGSRFAAAWSTQLPKWTEAILIPKLWNHFAEFLNEGSLERLRILSSPTCVRLRYGHHGTPTRLFLAAVQVPSVQPKLDTPSPPYVA